MKKYFSLPIKVLIWVANILIKILKVVVDLLIKLLRIIYYLGHVVSVSLGLLVLMYASLYVWNRIDNRVSIKHECIQKDNNGKCILVKKTYEQ